MAGQQRPQQARTAGQGNADAMLTGRCDGPGDNVVGRVVAAHGVDGDQRAGVRGRRAGASVLVGAVLVGAVLIAAVLIAALLVSPMLVASRRLGSGMPISGALPELAGLRLAGRLPAASRRSLVGIWLLRAPHAAKLLTARTRAGLARGR
jgi:hypothetical protein